MTMMKKLGRLTTLLVGCAGAAWGCGSVPDVIVEAVRTSGEEALRETIDEVIDTIVEKTIGELMTLTGLDPGSFLEGIDEATENGVTDAVEGTKR